MRDRLPQISIAAEFQEPDNQYDQDQNSSYRIFFAIFPGQHRIDQSIGLIHDRRDLSHLLRSALHPLCLTVQVVAYFFGDGLNLIKQLLALRQFLVISVKVIYLFAI